MALLSALPEELLREIFGCFNVNEDGLKSLLNLRGSCARLCYTINDYLRGRLTIKIGRSLESSQRKMRSCIQKTLSAPFEAYYSCLSLHSGSFKPEIPGAEYDPGFNMDRKVMEFLQSAVPMVQKIGHRITTMEVVILDSSFYCPQDLDLFYCTVALLLVRDNMPNLKTLRMHLDAPCGYLSRIVDCVRDNNTRAYGKGFLPRLSRIAFEMRFNKVPKYLVRNRLLGDDDGHYDMNLLDHWTNWDKWPLRAHIPVLSRLEAIHLSGDSVDEKWYGGSIFSPRYLALDSFAKALPKVKLFTYDGNNSKTKLQAATVSFTALETFRMQNCCGTYAVPLLKCLLTSWTSTLKRLELVDIQFYLSDDSSSPPPRISMINFPGQSPTEGFLPNPSYNADFKPDGIARLFDGLLGTFKNLESIRVECLSYTVWHLGYTVMWHGIHRGILPAAKKVRGSRYPRPLLVPFRNGDVAAFRRLRDGLAARRVDRGLSSDSWLNFLFEYEYDIFRRVTYDEMYGPAMIPQRRTGSPGVAPFPDPNVRAANEYLSFSPIFRVMPSCY